ncbi:MAG TPA: PBP1A family penicillin-binding protein [Verrucomicrobiae bacterium]|nr:PBP1A family penicillin-binding protein [Verrucomicrobiae bacterium]
MRGFLIGALLVVLFGAGLIGGMVAAYSRNLPDISRLADYQPESSTRIFARDGTLLASVYKENRTYVPLARIPLVVREAVIANEDHNFYYHHGVDFGGIMRAGFADLTHQEFQGASTITQQLARKLFLNDQVSISRKIQEALLAIEIERYYTKDEILERYLNIVYLGSGAYGVDAAAHTYFGESVDKLDLAQSAMIAGVIAAPSDYSPFVNLSLARDRQHHVLDRMVESGYITQAQADSAVNAPLGLAKERAPGLQGYLYPYYTTYVIAQLEKLFGKQAVEEGGLQVYTALDPRMQQEAQDAIDWGLQRAKSWGIHADEAALVSIRPSTGEIVAMVGGKGFSLDNQFNRAWQARRQPGSSFKLYVYTAAIDSGMPANTLIDDSPVSYPMGDGTMWSPQDDDNRYMGEITLRTALELSRNIVAVKLADRIGLDKIIDYAHRMGITSPLEPNLSLALGSSVVTPLDQATGYATIANQGIHIDPSAIRLVKDSLGNPVLDDQYPQANEVVSAGTAFIVTTMLEDVINHGTGYPNAIIGRPAAGKTGTTSDFRDAWFVGFTPDLVTAVWFGNDDYSRMTEAYGGGVPAMTWAHFMKAALAGVAKHDFTMPADQVVRLAGCSGGSEYYLISTEPVSGGCGTRLDTAQDPAAATDVPAATDPPSAAATPPPDSVGDGTHYIPLDSPAASPSVKPSAKP